MGPGKSLDRREKKSGEEKARGPNFFLARLDFSPAPLTAPGSPRMPPAELNELLGEFILSIERLQTIMTSRYGSEFSKAS